MLWHYYVLCNIPPSVIATSDTTEGGKCLTQTLGQIYILTLVLHNLSAMDFPKNPGNNSLMRELKIMSHHRSMVPRVTRNVY